MKTLIFFCITLFCAITLALPLSSPPVFQPVDSEHQRWGIWHEERVVGQINAVHVFAMHDDLTGQEIVCVSESHANHGGVSCWLTGRSWK